MVLLIGGAGCAGKTRFAQKLLEKRHMTYLSIDHLKMGFIRGIASCGFTALSRDAEISAALWPVILGIIETNIENEQSIAIEGCYLPQQNVKHLTIQYPNEVAAIYLVLSQEYIRGHFEDGILRYRNIAERRKHPESRTMLEIMGEHLAQKELCQRYDLPYVEIRTSYEREIETALNHLRC